MGLGKTLDTGMTKFENYNNSEVYKLRNYSITGRFVSGFVGFFVIVLMLMVTFSSAANSVMVSDLGGSKAYIGDLVITEVAGPSLSGTLNSEDSIDFGYIVSEMDWDHIDNLRISYFDVVVDWDANGGAGGGRQVTFDVSSQNNTNGQSQTDNGGEGIITIQWLINQEIMLNNGTISNNADSPEAFLSNLEVPGEWMGGTFTFSQSSTGSIILSESVDYTISLTMYTWNIENIREIQEL
jgi:hypothetical protein|tara:strand:+ start:4342 stop:5058 length:717 start_codon:yes stop_codon:yes gene_type:complete